MHLLFDPLDHMDEVTKTNYRRSLVKKGNDVNRRSILGDFFVADILLSNSEREVPFHWEIWVAEFPRRLVIYIGDEKKRPWEPGNFRLLTGWNRYTLHTIRKAYRMLCLGSWNQAMEKMEEYAEYAESCDKIKGADTGDSEGGNRRNIFSAYLERTSGTGEE